MQAYKRHVVIVGAGPTGLALALALARQGVRSTILEQRPQPDTHSRSAVLWPFTLDILEQWDVLAEFERAGRMLHQICPYWGQDTIPLAQWALDVWYKNPHKRGALILEQKQIEGILSHALARSGACEIQRGHRLVGFERLSEGIRCLVQPHQGQAYSLDGAFLIGCDGPQSTVRHQLGLLMQERHSKNPRYMAADLRILDDSCDQTPFPRIFSDGDKVTMAYPIRQRLWRIVGTLGTYEKQAGALSQASLDARYQAILPVACQHQTIWADTFETSQAKATQFFQGRVVLAGDAVRSCGWVGGESLCAGFEDAQNLAWKLARACDYTQTRDVQKILQSYQIERGEKVQMDLFSVLLSASQKSWLAPLLCNRIPRQFFRRTLQFMFTSHEVNQQFSQAIGLHGKHYQNSPLVLGRHPLVGMRAPDVLLQNEQGEKEYLLENLRGHGLLILFDAGKGEKILPMLRHGLAGIEGVALLRVVPKNRRAGPLSMRDVSMHAWQRWHAHDGMIALVRPDGYVGWVTTTSPTPEQIWSHIRHAMGLQPRPLYNTAPSWLKSSLSA